MPQIHVYWKWRLLHEQCIVEVQYLIIGMPNRAFELAEPSEAYKQNNTLIINTIRIRQVGALLPVPLRYYNALMHFPN